MTGKVVRKGGRVELPITGERVTEIRFGMRGPITLIFGERYDTELQIWDAVTLGRGSDERVLTGSRPGASFNIAELGPVLEVFGQTVVEAVALKDGTVQVCSGNALVLRVVPSGGYEAWHFRSPRLRLYGAHGYLI
jgi:hypothetical protein